MKFTSTKHASYFPLSPCEENRMKIGWTLNVVIVEAALARDERKWYLEQALCRGWSKTQLLNAIRSGIDSTEHLEQFGSPEKQVDQVAVEIPFSS